MRSAELAERLHGAIRRGDAWTARCPAHEDRIPSLAFRDADDRILIHCHAGCAFRQIITALGLAVSDLNFSSIRRSDLNGRIVRTFDYVDEKGSLLSQVVRYNPKRFQQRRPDGKGGWIYDLTGVRRVLYRLHAIILDLSQPIVFHEGERAVEAAIAAYLPGVHTTTAGGANNSHVTDLSPCAKRHVLICPDHDAPGVHYADALAARLHAIGAASVRIVRLPDLPEHGDVVEWLAAGGTPEQFEVLCLQAAPWPAQSELIPAPLLPSSIPNISQHLSDLGNARSLIQLHGKDLLYSHEFGWSVWNGSIWVQDKTGELVRRAADTIAKFYVEAASLTDLSARKALVDHARKSESEPRLRAMVSLASAEPGVTVSIAAMDQHPFLLPVANGVVDLHTGVIRAPRRKDLLTAALGVPFDETATCPNWDAFLWRAMSGNTRLIAFLQRAVGYSLTGSTGEQIFFLLHGDGANGKSTFVRTLLELVGPYGRMCPTQTLLTRKGEHIPNDLARLRGARAVAAVETDGGRRLSEALVKQLTGGDIVVARFLHHEFFEFSPQFKLWLAVNYKPRITGTDEAIWRRVKLIPFTVTIPPAERDRTLSDRLRAELPGILAWAVRGCLEWQVHGLQDPEEVCAATKQYREEEDYLGPFLRETCVLDASVSATKRQIYDVYVAWTKESGESCIKSMREFGTALRDRGFKDGYVERHKGWIGLRLRTSADNVEPTAAVMDEGYDVDLDL